MGYTHYFSFKKIQGKTQVNESLYNMAMRDCQRIIKRYCKENGGLSGYSAHTKLGQYGGLELNGKGADAHESLNFREHFSENDFGFCKTARKPYDLVVVACLAVLKHRLGESFSVTSDGKPIDWADGVLLARKVTGLRIQNPIKDKSKIAA